MSTVYQGFKVPLTRVLRRPVQAQNFTSSDLALANNGDYTYLAYIGIGGQNLSVIFDTGSADLWVISSDCQVLECQNVTTYNQTSSLSLTSTAFKLNYLIGSVSGTVGFETVSLGPYRISSQVFALANQTTGLGLLDIGNSGILGLAFPIEASIPTTIGQPFLKNLASYFPDIQRYFAVKLARDELNSSFTVGELDSSFANSTEKFNWTPVYKSKGSEYDYWKLPLRNITLNGTSLNELSGSKIPGSPTPIAILDTGTTLILGPANDVEYFWKSIGGARQDDSGLWQVLCSRGVIVSFALGDSTGVNEYVLDPQDVNWMEGGMEGEWCMGGVQANDNVNSGDWLLGDVFLRNVYVIHQLETSTSTPKIGLLSTTDANGAMASFRMSRGADNTATGINVVSNIRTSSQPKTGVVYGASIASGFAIGAVVTLLFLLKRTKSGARKREKQPIG